MSASRSESESAQSGVVSIDTTTPSIARAYDYAIGGKTNYEVDRELIHRMDEAVPEVRQIAISNRMFLIRVARFLAAKVGLDQFLDCGSGLPTAENTHEVVQRLNDEARVVYVDNDPVVLAHGRAILEENAHTRFVGADIFRPEQVLDNATVREFLDFSRPMGLLQVATLHHHDAEFGLPPADVMRAYIDALPSGSYVAFTHFLDPENEHTETAMRVQEIMRGAGGTGRGYWRTRAEIMEILGGLDLIEPGLVVNDDWWPDGPRVDELPSAAHCIAAAVGRKP
ncbi:SAM-dependent methyltransferase [Prauserella halophila]|uniref:SAM-dependent methyltransferase n=1 Tax=Prauserella halophila TaxID=185641 RepID=A0ABN1WJN3_9PSEU|nr:SAM-dependent methyltransferase [Prauserella halophila]MCP2237749.1 S-adenosyl methyltransferase [Prauserella halophila]